MSAGPTPVVCPACRQRLQIPLSAAGKTIRCPECDEDIPIPKAVPAAVPVPVAPPPAPVPDGPNPFDFDADDPAAAETDEGESAAVPFFTVIEARTWTANRKYRVYVRSKHRELVALYAGYGADAAMLGVIVTDDPGGRRSKRRVAKEAKSLDEWRNAHPFNFSLWAKDIEDAEIVKPSFWFLLNQHTVPQIGLLKLYTIEGNWTLAVATVEDMRRVLELLPPLLGDKLDVGIVWDKSRRRYVRA